jgi:hypothetical protein
MGWLPESFTHPERVDLPSAITYGRFARPTLRSITPP